MRLRGGQRDIERCEGNQVSFTDGSSVQADVIVACSGYKLVVPFFEPGRPTDPQQCYKYMFATDPSVAFVGFSLGALAALIGFVRGMQWLVRTRRSDANDATFGNNRLPGAPPRSPSGAPCRGCGARPRLPSGSPR